MILIFVSYLNFASPSVDRPSADQDQNSSMRQTPEVGGVTAGDYALQMARWEEETRKWMEQYEAMQRVQMDCDSLRDEL